MLHDEERGFFAAIQLHQAESPRTPTPPGGVTARSDSTKRTRRAATPRPSRCTPSGIAKRVDAGSHPVGYREARRSPTLELEPRAVRPSNIRREWPAPPTSDRFRALPRFWKHLSRRYVENVAAAA